LRTRTGARDAEVYSAKEAQNYHELLAKERAETERLFILKLLAKERADIPPANLDRSGKP
jgi:hypothetical protein